jgi:hypothetical protein
VDLLDFLKKYVAGRTGELKGWKFEKYTIPITKGTDLALLKKTGNLRWGKVENRQTFVLEQPRLLIPRQLKVSFCSLVHQEPCMFVFVCMSKLLSV